MTIPVSLRDELGFAPGSTVVAYVEQGRLVLERREHLLARLQALVREAATGVGASHTPVGELLVERRAEAAAEDDRP